MAAGDLPSSQQPLVPLVPNMTGYTTPSGRVFYSGTVWGNAQNYNCFNWSNKTQYDQGCSGCQENDSWIAYEFEEPVVPKLVYIMNEEATPAYMGDFKIEASNDGEEWTELASLSNPQQGNASASFIVYLENTESWNMVRLHNLTAGSGSYTGYGWAIQQLQFYGY